MVNFIKFLLKIFFAIFYKVEIIGKENLPKSGSGILCSNHIAWMDMLFTGYKVKRVIRYMAKEELFKGRLASEFLKSIGAFPVSRGKGDIGAIKTSLKLLKSGHILGIFPEATRTRGKDRSEIKPKPGAAMLAISSGAPIIPVAVEGSYKLFTKVKVVFGKPYYLNNKEAKATKDELLKYSEDIMKNIYSLLEEK